jgi:hypothetical protein
MHHACSLVATYYSLTMHHACSSAAMTGDFSNMIKPVILAASVVVGALHTSFFALVRFLATWSPA